MSWVPTVTDDRSRRRFFLGLALIAAAALLVRLVYVLAVKHGGPLLADEPYYHVQSDRLADGVGYKTGSGPNGAEAATHPPLATLVLSIASRFASGDSVLEQRLALVVLGVTVVVLLGLLARDLAGPRAGLITAGLAALTPMLWQYDGVLLSEPLAAVLIVLTLWCAYRYLREPRILWAALLGLTCGLAMLTRGELAFLVPFVLLPVLVFGHPATVGQRVGRIAAAGVAALLVVGPWVGYNMSRFDKPVYLSVTVGGAICGAYNDEAFSGPRIGLWVPEDCPLPNRRQVPPGSDQSVISSYWSEVGLDYFQGHVTELPTVVAARLGRVLGVYAPGQTNDEAVREGVPEKVAWAAYASFFVFVALGVWGAVVLRRRRVPIYPLLGAIAVVVVATAAFYGLFRYRLAADLALVVLAGIGVDELWGRLVARRRGSGETVAAAAPVVPDAEHDEDVERSPATPPL
jgi:4-amino-4-deoxy-L-arabinose transferase-like glycosyltransferase